MNKRDLSEARMDERLRRGGPGRTGAPILAALLGLALAGCVHESPYRGVNNALYTEKQGPPPWAPAHGYRYKHAGGALLVYDAGLGTYRVEGRPDCYFYGSRFFCRRGGAWNAGPALGGPWTVISVDKLPPGIAKKWGAGPAKGHHKNKHDGKEGHGHGHGHGPYY